MTNLPYIFSYITIKVIGVLSSSKAMEGFALMEFHKVPAVAVINESGELLATLSASGIRLIY